MFKQFVNHQSFFDGILEHYGTLEGGIKDFFERNFPLVSLQKEVYYEFGPVIDPLIVQHLPPLRTLNDEQSLDIMMQ